MELNDIVVLEDDRMIVLNKPAGILSQAAPGGKVSVAEVVKAKWPNAHILGRLDRPVSGMMIASVDKSFTQHYLRQQQKGKVLKYYIAIVEGHPGKEEGILKHTLIHDKLRKKAFVADGDEGRKAELGYRTLTRLDRYSMVLITIKSGKFHQIRAQLAAAGHPVKGDVKYGARRKNPDRSIHLHAYSIAFDDELGERLQPEVLPEESDTLWRLAREHLTKKQ